MSCLFFLKGNVGHRPEPPFDKASRWLAVVTRLSFLPETKRTFRVRSTASVNGCVMQFRKLNFLSNVNRTDCGRLKVERLALQRR
jgi:hypothetical protein